MTTQLPARLILASGSPRRKTLLQSHGYCFDVIVPHDSVEASVSRDLAPKEFVAAAAVAKANAIAMTLNQGVVLAADTVAVCDDTILGKPSDRQDAKRILQILSGRDHDVITGVALHNAATNRSCVNVETTSLRMRAFTENELSAYLDTDGWVGKAGAFGYQDGLNWVKIIDGLESNVVGLPVERLPSWLATIL